MLSNAQSSEIAGKLNFPWPRCNSFRVNCSCHDDCSLLLRVPSPLARWRRRRMCRLNTFYRMVAF